MTIEEIYQSVLDELNKDQTGEYVSPVEFNRYLKRAGLDLLRYRYGAPEEYRPGISYGSVGWEVTAKMSDDMRPIKVSLDGSDKAPLRVGSNGYAALPSDYMHQSSAKFRTGGDVEFLTDDEFTSRVGSDLKKPSLRHPVARIAGSQIQFVPSPKDAMVNFYYLRKPVDGYFDYIVVNDAVVYLEPGASHDGSVLASGTKSRSVETEWPIQTHTDIIALILSYVSNRYRSPFMRNVTDMRKNSGK